MELVELETDFDGVEDVDLYGRLSSVLWSSLEWFEDGDNKEEGGEFGPSSAWISLEGMGWSHGPLMVGAGSGHARSRPLVKPRRRW